MFFLLLLLGCTSGVKYGVGFSANTDIGMEVVKGNMGQYRAKRYSDCIAEQSWRDATDHGFLSGNNNILNFYQNNDLEEGLSYIFFNTLRAKLRAGVRHENLGLWGNQYDVMWYNNFKCPKPWKYDVRTINGVEYGVFYLDCIQMGEYHRIDNSNSRNYDRIKDGLSPHMKVHYIDKNTYQPKSTSFVVEIDHLLRDNNYLIELPKTLHNLKTKFLDPFILGRTNTVRSRFTTNQYWKKNKEYIKALDNNDQCDNCLCGGVFQQPVTNRIVNHIHDEPWRANWIASMKGTNMP